MKVKPTGYFLIHQYIDISALAQLMRYSHGAGASAEYNPSEKTGGQNRRSCQFCTGEAKAETALYLPDRLGVSLLFPAKKVTPQTPDGVCNMGALRFAMKLVLSGSVGASAAIELGVTVDWSGEMGKGYGIKGRPATLTAPPLPGQQQVNLKTSTIPEAQGEVKLVFLLVLRREVISVVPLSGLTRILMIRQ